MKDLKEISGAYSKVIHIDGFNFKIISNRAIDEVDAYLHALTYYHTSNLSDMKKGKIIDVIDHHNVSANQYIPSRQAVMFFHTQ